MQSLLYTHMHPPTHSMCSVASYWHSLSLGMRLCTRKHTHWVDSLTPYKLPSIFTLLSLYPPTVPELQDPACSDDLCPSYVPRSHLLGSCSRNTSLWDLSCPRWRPGHNHPGLHPTSPLPPTPEVEVHCHLAKSFSPSDSCVWNCCDWSCDGCESLPGDWASGRWCKL